MLGYLLNRASRRFSARLLDVYRGVHALNPSSLMAVSFLDLISLSRFKKHYGVDTEGINHEIAIHRKILLKGK